MYVNLRTLKKIKTFKPTTYIYQNGGFGLAFRNGLCQNHSDVSFEEDEPGKNFLVWALPYK